MALSMRWIREAAQKRGEVDARKARRRACGSCGGTRRRNEEAQEVHRMAEANKASRITGSGLE
jgi:hypothetical protein